MAASLLNFLACVQDRFNKRTRKGTTKMVCPMRSNRPLACAETPALSLKGAGVVDRCPFLTALVKVHREATFACVSGQPTPSSSLCPPPPHACVQVDRHITGNSIFALMLKGTKKNEYFSLTCSSIIGL